MVLRTVRYLAQQGYGAQRIAVLMPYLGQLHFAAVRGGCSGGGVFQQKPGPIPHRRPRIAPRCLPSTTKGARERGATSNCRTPPLIVRGSSAEGTSTGGLPLPLSRSRSIMDAGTTRGFVSVGIDNNRRAHLPFCGLNPRWTLSSPFLVVVRGRKVNIPNKEQTPACGARAFPRLWLMLGGEQKPSETWYHRASMSECMYRICFKYTVVRAYQIRRSADISME
jgi:hypothetical protein